MTTLFLMVGLPAAGKTTLAKQLAHQHRALRLTPDAWMGPLFGEPEAGMKRDVMEGRLLWLALEALRIGTDVVLDFGCWARNERSAVRWLANSVGASCQMTYLPIDPRTQLARIRYRQETAPEATFPVGEGDFELWREMFQPPDDAELSSGKIPAPPPGWTSWAAWAAVRWPSLVES